MMILNVVRNSGPGRVAGANLITKNMILKRQSSIVSSAASKITNNDNSPITMNFTCKNDTLTQGPKLSNNKKYQQVYVRYKRKAGKMGQHLKNLEEIAHREEHERAKEKRKNKKGKNKNSKEEDVSEAAAQQMAVSDNEIPTIKEDETETVFDHGGNENDGAISLLPSKDDVKSRMMKVINAMEESFKAIRGAEATPELFDHVQVRAYGSFTPLNGVAQVVINTPTRATITCFDPDVAPAVSDAIRDAGMNFNPIVEDGVVVVPIPRVSAETRKALVKQLGTTAESTRQRIRRIRRGAQDVVKKAKDGKLEGISEDDAFRTGKEIDSVTEECIKALNHIVEQKQARVMNV